LKTPLINSKDKQIVKVIFGIPIEPMALGLFDKLKLSNNSIIKKASWQPSLRNKIGKLIDFTMFLDYNMNIWEE